MKKRMSFVANSSSSSFLLITAGDVIISGSDYEPDFEIDSISLDIDRLIKTLQEAKAKGIKTVDIDYGGGYDG